ncbi:MAG: hypothetical protein EOO19_00420 [Chryseobacterium sp.]|nr:MAG: hypothetical protein EOO19_00420 [Chryseobacterium sp.]
MEIWKNKNKGDDKLIVYYNNAIYKGNPKNEEIESTIYKLKTDNIAPSNLMSIPLAYLKEVNFEEGKKYIEVLFGTDSSEHMTITDENKKVEIFEYLKNNIPNSENYVDTFSKFRAGKKPLIALLFISLLFIWVLYLALKIEHGNQYEIIGGHYNSISGIALGLASLGVKNVLLLFGTFFSLGIYGLITKTRRPKIVHKIIVRR